MEVTLPRRPRILAARYLLLALVLHGLLLALPGLNRQDAAPAEAVLSIRLQHPQARARIVPVAQPELKPPRPPLHDPRPEPAPAARGLPSAARLLDSVHELQPAAATAPARAPGRVTHSEHYAAMRRPLLDPQTTLFSAYAAPLETEVVDRWLEPGGVHQVVIRAPGGTTLCGRQEPVDDFRPWTQIPMLFSDCGGGGKR